MKAESILNALYTPLYAILAVLGLVLLYTAVAADDVLETAVGIGAVILGVLGLEARGIADALRESQEAK